jgi:hypothetical protein
MRARHRRADGGRMKGQDPVLGSVFDPGRTEIPLPDTSPAASAQRWESSRTRRERDVPTLMMGIGLAIRFHPRCEESIPMSKVSSSPQVIGVPWTLRSVTDTTEEVATHPGRAFPLLFFPGAGQLFVDSGSAGMAARPGRPSRPRSSAHGKRVMPFRFRWRVSCKRRDRIKAGLGPYGTDREAGAGLRSGESGNSPRIPSWFEWLGRHMSWLEELRPECSQEIRRVDETELGSNRGEKASSIEAQSSPLGAAISVGASHSRAAAPISSARSAILGARAKSSLHRRLLPSESSISCLIQ